MCHQLADPIQVLFIPANYNELVEAIGIETIQTALSRGTATSLLLENFSLYDFHDILYRNYMLSKVVGLGGVPLFSPGFDFVLLEPELIQSHLEDLNDHINKLEISERGIHIEDLCAYRRWYTNQADNTVIILGERSIASGNQYADYQHFIKDGLDDLARHLPFKVVRELPLFKEFLQEWNTELFVRMEQTNGKLAQVLTIDTM